MFQPTLTTCVHFLDSLLVSKSFKNYPFRVHLLVEGSTISLEIGSEDKVYNATIKLYGSISKNHHSFLRFQLYDQNGLIYKYEKFSFNLSDTAKMFHLNIETLNGNIETLLFVCCSHHSLKQVAINNLVNMILDSGLNAPDPGNIPATLLDEVNKIQNKMLETTTDEENEFLFLSKLGKNLNIIDV